MPAFPKPQFAFEYNPAEEIKALRAYRKTAPGREIPAKSTNRLLLATWNIANLGVQDRAARDYKLLAEMLGWFDLVAVQEVNDDLSGLRGVLAEMPKRYRVRFSPASGNDERLAFIYDGSKVTPLEKVGAISVPPEDLKFITLDGVLSRFEGFSRAPYVGAFEAGGFRFQLVNVHLYFGDDSLQSIERRSLEAYAIGRWADLRGKSKNAFLKDIIALGDFNLPKVEESDPIYKALTRRGLFLPQHSNKVGSSVATDSHYDQLAFFPSETEADFTGRTGVFDYDGALFRKLWEEKTHAQFFAFLRYYISDHRILWSEFKI